MIVFKGNLVFLVPDVGKCVLLGTSVCEHLFMYVRARARMFFYLCPRARACTSNIAKILICTKNIFEPKCWN
jgi:hypothetical protein